MALIRLSHLFVVKLFDADKVFFCILLFVAWYQGFKPQSCPQFCGLLSEHLQ